MPLCRNQIGGYTLPKDNASRKRWVTAVKWVSGNNKPWSPKQRRLPLISPSVAVMLIQKLLNRYNSQLSTWQILIRHIFLNRNL